MSFISRGTHEAFGKVMSATLSKSAKTPELLQFMGKLLHIHIQAVGEPRIELATNCMSLTQRSQPQFTVLYTLRFTELTAASLTLETSYRYIIFTPLKNTEQNLL